MITFPSSCHTYHSSESQTVYKLDWFGCHFASMYGFRCHFAIVYGLDAILTSEA